MWLWARPCKWTNQFLVIGWLVGWILCRLPSQQCALSGTDLLQHLGVLLPHPHTSNFSTLVCCCHINFSTLVRCCHIHTHPTSTPWCAAATSTHIQLQHLGVLLPHPHTSNFSTLVCCCHIQLQHLGVLLPHPTSTPWCAAATSNFSTLVCCCPIHTHPTSAPWCAAATSNFSTLVCCCPIHTHPTSTPWCAAATSNFSTLVCCCPIHTHPTSTPWCAAATSNFNTLVCCCHIQFQHLGVLLPHPTSTPWCAAATSTHIQLQHLGVLLPHPTSTPWCAAAPSTHIQLQHLGVLLPHPTSTPWCAAAPSTHIQLQHLGVLLPHPHTSIFNTLVCCPIQLPVSPPVPVVPHQAHQGKRWPCRTSYLARQPLVYQFLSCWNQSTMDRWDRGWGVWGRGRGGGGGRWCWRALALAGEGLPHLYATVEGPKSSTPLTTERWTILSRLVSCITNVRCFSVTLIKYKQCNATILFSLAWIFKI